MAVPDLQTKTVVFERLDVKKVLKGLNLNSIQELCEKLQIKKQYRFETRIGETPGQPVLLLEVLAKYSDEPDWGMDRELFEEDQYPELYGIDIALMGGKKGTASQFFRHAYLPFDLLSPVLSLKAPYIFSSMGAAPSRGALFVKLSQLAKQNNSPYWAARFLGCSLHYVADVSQPFHTTQTPTKQYLWKSLPALLGGNIVHTITKVISYYHWAYERAIGAILDGRIGTSEQQVRFLNALKNPSKDGDFNYKGMNAAVKKTAQYALRNSGVSGKESILFFPEIPGSIVDFNPIKFMDENWWRDVDKRFKKQSPVLDHYLNTVEAQFQYLGAVIRTVTREEL
jgi:hypothetical protein